MAMGGVPAVHAGRGRIIVTPELASGPSDRLAAMVAHEAGHAACSHMWKRQAMAAASSACAFATMGWAASRPGLAAEFGADAANAGVTLLVAWRVAVLLHPVGDVAWNAMSRRHEREADAFCARAVPPATAMACFEGVLDVEAGAGANWLHTILNLGYPPIAERAGRIREAARRLTGG